MTSVQDKIKRNAYSAVVSLSTVDSFREIFRICENQKTISTSKLLQLLEDAEDNQRISCRVITRYLSESKSTTKNFIIGDRL